MIDITLIALVFFFFCWGSFLNVVGHRLVNDKSLLGRSCCPRCSAPIAWYDNIPAVSWFMLRGKCRACSKPISILYPLIEFLTPLLLTTLYLSSHYFLGYFVFFSALIVTIRSDLESFLISRLVTLTLIPVGVIFSVMDLIPILPMNSILGAAFGYALLWIVAKISYAVKKIECIGQGDLDLLALIGSFTGIVGVWTSITVGSLLGSLLGIIYLGMIGKLQRNARIPFGPFLALGAIIFVLFQDLVMYYFVL